MRDEGGSARGRPDPPIPHLRPIRRISQSSCTPVFASRSARALSARPPTSPGEASPAHGPVGRARPLTPSRLRSWSQWKLHDPRSAQVDGSVQRNDAAAISLESVGDLVASSEIDFRTLRRDLHDLLGMQPKLSISQALSQREAPQGLGSVIGYLSLGTRFGTVVEGEQELAHWRGGDGQWRRARIPLVWFTQEKRHELE